MERPFVIQTEDLDTAAAAWLRESCELVHCPFTEQPRFEQLLPRADGLLVRTYTRVDGAMLDKAPKLRCVARAGVGLERIDVKECRRRGIEVVHTPDANSIAVSEFVFALLHDALRPRTYLRDSLVSERWNQTRREMEAPAQFNELTLGVLGLGRVGSRVARIGAAMGMEVLYNDIVRIPADRRRGAVPVPLDELLRRSDILTIHIDSRPGNEQFVNAGLFVKLKPSVIVVNTSRGLVISARDLADFLRGHPQARALIDVHDPEPFGPEYPLLGLPNAMLSPHIAAATMTAHVNMSWVVKDLWRVLRGERPENPAP